MKSGDACDFISGRSALIVKRCTGLMKPLSQLIADYAEDEGWNLIYYPLKSRARTCVATAMDGRYLYVMGGVWRESPVFVDHVEVFDFLKGKWKRTSQAMNVKRAHAACVITPNGQSVIVIGGYFRELKLSITGGSISPVVHRTMEVMDTKTRTWKTLRGRMREARWSPGVCLSPDGGKLYVVGGGDKKVDWNRGLKSAEYYDMERAKFFPLPPMSKARIGPGIALSQDGKYLFVVGGDFDTSKNSAECYSFETKKWTALPDSKLFARCRSSVWYNSKKEILHVVGGQIPSVGGSRPIDLQDIYECFDLKTRSWRFSRTDILQELSFHRDSSPNINSFHTFTLDTDKARIYSVGQTKVSGTIQHMRLWP
mmetsp:Transcript_13763/g.20777  ORF Transcript_13763/g.20777 Transcript_13763/m.20777 type:complete len:369 (+) Transcript_13763:495-1601(+)